MSESFLRRFKPYVKAGSVARSQMLAGHYVLRLVWGPEPVPVPEPDGANVVAVANYDDVSTTEGGENIIKTATDNFGGLDVLVNNAGILRDRMVFNMSPEEWDAVIKVHLYGHFNCTKPACVIMRQQKSGRIINFSSSSGLGNMGQANYAAAKEGIIGFTRTVARDMGKYGITCNAIRPAAWTRLTNTPELQKARERAASSGVTGGGAISEEMRLKMRRGSWPRPSKWFSPRIKQTIKHSRIGGHPPGCPLFSCAASDRPPASRRRAD